MKALQKLLLLGCLTLGLAEFGKPELIDFVIQKMANYSSWLKTNNLDPSPVSTGPGYFKTLEIGIDVDTFVRNHAVQGHSDGIEITYARANLFLKTFTLTVKATGNVTFFGEYVSNGSFVNASQILVPLSGHGEWHIRVPHVELYLFMIWFDVTPSGYLNLTKSELLSIEPESTGSDIYFQNLWADDAVAASEEFIKQTMFRGFRDYLDVGALGKEHPLRTQYLEFWKEILSETTLEDIEGAN